MQMQRINYYCFLMGKLKMTATLSFLKIFAWFLYFFFFFLFFVFFFFLFWFCFIALEEQLPLALGRIPTSTDLGPVIVSGALFARQWMELTGRRGGGSRGTQAPAQLGLDWQGVTKTTTKASKRQCFNAYFHLILLFGSDCKTNAVPWGGWDKCRTGCDKSKYQNRKRKHVFLSTVLSGAWRLMLDS